MLVQPTENESIKRLRERFLKLFYRMPFSLEENGFLIGEGDCKYDFFLDFDGRLTLLGLEKNIFISFEPEILKTMYEKSRDLGMEEVFRALDYLENLYK